MHFHVASRGVAINFGFPAGVSCFKAAYSVPFDLLILDLMFLFFKNTVKNLKFRYTFYLFRKS